MFHINYSFFVHQIIDLYKKVISEKVNNYYNVKLFKILEQIINANKEIVHYQNRISIKDFKKIELEHAEHLIELGDLLKAKEILENLNDESNFDVLNNLAVIAIIEERFKDAIEIILNVIEKNPTDEIALSNLQYLQSILGDKKEILNNLFQKNIFVPQEGI